MILRALIIFLCGCAFDFMWVCWISAVAGHHVASAAGLSMALGVISLYSVSEFISDRKLGAVWIAGLGIGTTLAMIAGAL